MARFIRVGKAIIDSERLLAIEYEWVINAGVPSGSAFLTFSGGEKVEVRLCGETLDQVFERLAPNREEAALAASQ